MSGKRPTILIFDSGVGGLTVLDPIRTARPDARYIYVGDTACFPYGRMAEEPLIKRVHDVIGDAIRAHRPDLIVIACHTASTLVLPSLRAAYEIPIIGTVPAIKPAAEASKSGLISVLATEGTVKRDYTNALIRDFAGACRVTLVSAQNLAGLAEQALHGEPVPNAAILAEIAPAFVEDQGRKTDHVVLACTHYPLLLDRLTKLAPWPVTFIDPAPAIARRVVQLIGEAPAALAPQNDGLVTLTGADQWTRALTEAFAARGLTRAPN